MKRFLAIAAACGLAFSTIGCNTSPQGGTPGTTSSFKVSGPALTTNLKQGEKETVKVSVSRGSDFKKNVDIKVEAPKGLTVAPASGKVAPGDSGDWSFTVEAEKTAPLGEHIVKVMATPEAGTATSVDVKVKVNEGPKS